VRYCWRNETAANRGGPSFSSIATSYCDEHRGCDAKYDSGEQTWKQPFATDHERTGDYRQASHHDGSMDQELGHCLILTQKQAHAKLGRRLVFLAICLINVSSGLRIAFAQT
jgi:hypothetical protein